MRRTLSGGALVVFALAALVVGAGPAHAATYTVSNLTDCATSGCGSLRQAILDANANEGSDTIEFSVAGTISPTSALPTITDQVDIHGQTAPGYDDSPVVEIDGTSAGAGSNGFTIDSNGSFSTIQALAINDFSGGARAGIRVTGAFDVDVSNNYIGTNLAGTSAQGNSFGIWLEDVAGGRIGGIIASDANVISGNNTAVFVDGGSGNLISGNSIGTNAAGTAAVPNTFAVQLFGSSFNIIGATEGAEGNVISGNSAGILLNDTILTGAGPTAVEFNQIQGNFIGTLGDGATPLGNTGGFGIDIAGSAGAASTTITENVIAYNGLGGVGVESGASLISIRRNSIFANDGLGIDLERDFAVNDNDAGDEDTGANELQNFPVITDAGGMVVNGTLDSAPSTSFDINLFRSSACDGSGQRRGRGVPRRQHRRYGRIGRGGVRDRRRRPLVAAT